MSSVVLGEAYRYKRLSKQSLPFSKKRKFYKEVAKGLLEISRYDNSVIVNVFTTYLTKISECEAIENYDEAPTVASTLGELKRNDERDDKLALDSGFKL